MRARCKMPVQIYDSGLEGYYEPGQIVDGDRGRLLVDRYGDFFDAVPESKTKAATAAPKEAA